MQVVVGPTERAERFARFCMRLPFSAAPRAWRAVNDNWPTAGERAVALPAALGEIKRARSHAIPRNIDFVAELIYDQPDGLFSKSRRRICFVRGGLSKGTLISRSFASPNLLMTRKVSSIPAFLTHRLPDRRASQAVIAIPFFPLECCFRQRSGEP